MTIAKYTVKGMTCGHCVAAVSEELSKLASVTDVAVDLPTGEVAITSEDELSVDAVRAAVDEAGYELVS